MSYYKHLPSGNVYKFLFEAEDKSYYGFEPSEKIIDIVYEDSQGKKYTRQKEEFEEKFKPCNPPIDWLELYNNKFLRLLNSLKYFEESFRLASKSNFDEEFLNRYEEIKNKVLPYTVKRLSRYKDTTPKN